MGRYLLEQFRDLEINKEELKSKGGEKLLNSLDDKPVIICNQHLIQLLEEYINGKLMENRILEWVNTIWFSDAFDYCDYGSDCIASIMNSLEEIDEGFILNTVVAQDFLKALMTNEEV